MEFARLKKLTTLLLVGSHLLTSFWIVVLYFLGGFAFDELTTAVALLMPLFAGFTTAIVRDAIAEAALLEPVPPRRQLPWGFTFLMLAFSTSFVVFLLFIVTLKGFNIGFTTFDQFKVLLGVSETAFGVYVGYLLPILFTQGGVVTSSPVQEKPKDTDPAS